MKKLFLSSFIFLMSISIISQESFKNVPLADPFILLYEGTYYAYGTGSPDGIEVITSNR
jgi:hypothetical protein